MTIILHTDRMKHLNKAIRQMGANSKFKADSNLDHHSDENVMSWALKDNPPGVFGEGPNLLSVFDSGEGMSFEKTRKEYSRSAAVKDATQMSWRELEGYFFPRSMQSGMKVGGIPVCYHPDGSIQLGGTLLTQMDFEALIQERTDYLAAQKQKYT